MAVEIRSFSLCFLRGYGYLFLSKRGKTVLRAESTIRKEKKSNLVLLARVLGYQTANLLIVILLYTKNGTKA